MVHFFSLLLHIGSDRETHIVEEYAHVCTSISLRTIGSHFTFLASIITNDDH